MPCGLHDPATAEARHQRAVELGKAGAAARRERKAEQAKAPIPLRTYEDNLRWLERLASLVTGASGKIPERVGAAVRVAQQSIQMLKDEIERKAEALCEERKQLEADREELDRERREFEAERARSLMS